MKAIHIQTTQACHTRGGGYPDQVGFILDKHYLAPL